MGDDFCADRGYFSIIYFHLEVDMATLAQASVPKLARIAYMKKRDNFIENATPRFCMVMSTGMILTGLCIPALILVQVLPTSLLLCLAGFALVAIGGVLWLAFYGDL